MTTFNENRRTWQTSDGSIRLRYTDDFGDTSVREFWVPSDGGYVREVDTQHPGTLGAQVCQRLESRGSTLSSTRAALLDLIRREYRRAMTAVARRNAI